MEDLKKKLKQREKEIANLKIALKKKNSKRNAELERHADSLADNVADALEKQVSAEKSLSVILKRVADVRADIVDVIGFNDEPFEKLVGRLISFHLDDVEKMNGLNDLFGNQQRQDGEA